MNERLAVQHVKFLKETIDLKREIEINYVELGKRLLQIRDHELYLANHESFNEFLEELKISPATASKLISIYVIFVLNFGFKPMEIGEAGGWSVVAEGIGVVKTKKQAKSFLHEAKHLTRNDLRITLTERKTGKDQYKCRHKDYYMIRFCRDCKNREVIEDSQHVKEEK